MLHLLGSDNGISRIQCIGKTGIGIFHSKAVTIMHLEFSGCAADFSDDVKWHAGIGILYITDLNISKVVVTNSTGWGVLANNILGTSQNPQLYIHLQQWYGSIFLRWEYFFSV